MLEEISSNLDINRHIALLWRKRRLVLAIALGVLSLFTWGSFFIPKVYEASATVFIEKSGLMNPLIQGVGVFPRTIACATCGQPFRAGASSSV